MEDVGDVLPEEGEVDEGGGVEEALPAPPLASPLPVVASLVVDGVGWGVLAGGLAAPEESARLPPELVPEPSASSASTRPSVAARELLASESAGPGPISAPSAIPTASIAVARIAPTLREGSLGAWGGRGAVIVGCGGVVGWTEAGLSGGWMYEVERDRGVAGGAGGEETGRQGNSGGRGGLWPGTAIPTFSILSTK